LSLLKPTKKPTKKRQRNDKETTLLKEVKELKEVKNICPLSAAKPSGEGTHWGIPRGACHARLEWWWDSGKRRKA
jgi:hypothetical protein